MTSRPTIVTIAGDAGGAAALAPVLSRLHVEGNVTLVNYSYYQASTILADAGIASTQLGAIDRGEAARLFQQAGASMLLTATSVNDLELEKHFVSAARRLGAPSIGVLDFWSNYAARFADGNGRAHCAPDVLAVMDDRAAAEVREIGVTCRIAITGQPAFDQLTAEREKYTPPMRQEVRRALGAGDADLLVLFVSQAFNELYGDAKAQIGFDQHEVLGLVVRTLATEDSGQQIVLAVRKHPREMPEFTTTESRFPLVFDRTPNRWHAVMAADLVVGMNSALLLEASYLGAAVLSLQPELRGVDILPSNRSGGSAAAYGSRESATLLSAYVSHRVSRERLRAHALSFAPDGRATERVCACVYQQLTRLTPAVQE